ncbi:hypothetical protein [Streptococcus zhangguiae]|uniref:Uncharacterized protein n=1 Tax=Streptococcus zhangguiae TaxID=2664091 RepID=A0A6I4RSW0_9STRE|nr:hypothetical protein [Streptococcus sp. zg-70]MWV55912.1 hypothetical protein [Streptococcus sp. zg-70]
MQSNIVIDENLIKLNGVENVFNYPIAEVKQIGTLYIVRLAIPMNISLDKEDFNNVYCMDNTGKIIWQIQNIQPVDCPEFTIAPIVLINLNESQLFVTDFMGRKYEVKLQTGEMELKRITK